MQKLENTIQYSFKARELLEEALTHPSVKRSTKTNFSYQRLEFLGDKALGLVVANELLKNFQNEDEGQISRRHNAIVAKNSLSSIAKKLAIGNFIILSKNQEADGGRESENILENVLEALIGAIFLDGGLNEVQKFVERFFDIKINLEAPKDSKSALQEWFQKKYKKLPKYLLEKSENGIFTTKITVFNQDFFGEGKSIKEAEKECAKNALKHISSR
jgi:ribonuclease-3